MLVVELNKKLVERGVPFVRFMEGIEVRHRTYQLHMHRYVFGSRFTRDKVVLDAGCGVGYGSSYLAKKGAEQVVGGDIWEEAISYAAMCYKRERADFVRLDISRLPFSDDSFDVVVAFEVIEHLKDYEGFLSECKRVLKVGGPLICSTPNRDLAYLPFPWKPLFSYWHVKEFHLKEFRNLVGRYFDVEGMYGQHLLGKQAKILYQLRGAIRSALAFLRLGIIQRLIFPEPPPIIFREQEIDRTLRPEGEVLPLRPGLTPEITVIVAKAGKSRQSPGSPHSQSA
jgi:SAM-dependent methyltransferase